MPPGAGVALLRRARRGGRFGRRMGVVRIALAALAALVAALALAAPASAAPQLRGGRRTRRHHPAHRLLHDGLGSLRRRVRRPAHPALGAGDRARARRPKDGARGRGPRRNPRRDAGRGGRAGLRPRLLAAKRPRLRLPHPLRADRLLQLRHLQHGLHDHQLAHRLPAHRRPRPAALHLHGPPPGAGDPPRRRQPRAGEARLGEDPDHRPDRQPLRGGSPSKPRHPRGLRRGKRQPGPAGPPAHARSRRQRAAGRQDDRRAPGAGGDVVDVRRPRHRDPVPVHLLQPRPPRRRHPAGRGRDPPRRPGAPGPGGGERLRQHRRGRPDRGPSSRRPGGGRLCRQGRGAARSCAPGARPAST